LIKEKAVLTPLFGFGAIFAPWKKREEKNNPSGE
jgi:hypothetical protein